MEGSAISHLCISVVLFYYFTPSRGIFPQAPFLIVKWKALSPVKGLSKIRGAVTILWKKIGIVGKSVDFCNQKDLSWVLVLHFKGEPSSLIWLSSLRFSFSIWKLLMRGRNGMLKIRWTVEFTLWLSRLRTERFLCEDVGEIPGFVHNISFWFLRVDSMFL